MCDIYETVVELSLKQFASLPKTGKPTEKEWTILSCIVQELNGKCDVVALGTGSKCVGQNKLSLKGDILNDSHAEIMCRRGFLNYIYDAILSQKNDIVHFNENRKKFSLNEELKFHFFTTHVPCGDAAIFLKPQPEDVGAVCARNSFEDTTPTKKIKLDIFRTGAKCLDSDKQQDSKLEGPEYHIVGVVRTKPGRGIRTLSVSCSDKISRWCHLGIQGALLSILLDKPIYLSSFIIVGDAPFDQQSLERALYTRLNDVTLDVPYKQSKIEICQRGGCFRFSKTNGKNPCPNSIVWYISQDKNYKGEVAVEGRKLGVTKRNLDKSSSRLSICKLELLKTFVTVIKKFTFEISSNIDNLNYREIKLLATQYQKNWTTLKSKYGIWTNKDHKLLLFYAK